MSLDTALIDNTSNTDTTLIERSLVPDDARIDFLPLYAGKWFLRFEQYVYHFMNKYCAAYNGGYWEFYTLNNGGFYMGLSGEKDLNISNACNYFDDEMSADAASIGVCLFALCNLACTRDEEQSEHFAELYHKLRDYAIEHAEVSKIMRFID